MVIDQCAIGSWHRSTFPGCLVHSLLFKLHEEVDELSEVLARGGLVDNQEMRDELADVAIVLMAIADRCGIDLLHAIDDKFPRVVKKYGDFANDEAKAANP